MSDADIRHILEKHGHEWMAFARALLVEERERCCSIVVGLCLSDNNAHEIISKIREAP